MPSGEVSHFSAIPPTSSLSGPISTSDSNCSRLMLIGAAYTVVNGLKLSKSAVMAIFKVGGSAARAGGLARAGTSPRAAATVRASARRQAER